MNEEGPLNDSVFDDSGPFSVMPDGAGVPLDQALREFGPAAIDDLIPRLRALAADLDEAHAAGFVHGRLHPSKVLITEDATYLMGRRVPASATLTRDTDQYALAAMAYEWMFGRPITGPAERPVDVRSLPGVDRAALSQAFTRALSSEPSHRFASCSDFVDAIAGAIVPSLPLLAADENDDPVGPFMPEDPAPADPIPPPVAVPDLSFTAEESNATAAGPDLDAMNPVALPPTPVPSWQPSAMTVPERPAERTGERFSGFALILATIVGMVVGFAAGYMARPRALQSDPAAETASAGTDSEVRPSVNASAPARSESRAPQRDETKTPPPASKAPTSTSKAPSASQAPVQAPTKVGRLLVRSTPSGASVEVDGVARGVTPLALRDLDLGSREITVSQSGYVPEERRVVLTKARPSRSVEVRLSASAAPERSGVTPREAPPQPSAGAPRPSTPASLGKPPAATGVLVVESLPPGASVTVDGKPSGTTPVTLNDLAPGDYRVTMSMPGYRDFETTVRVVAGERARAAARLTQQEQE